MSTPAKQLVWFITGTSTGIGRELTLAALKRGEKVIATARNIAKIDDLKKAGADILQLDVTDSLDNLHAITKEAVKIHGRIDVLVNNAAYGEIGVLEENTPEETYRLYNTLVFGALNTIRAVLPYMRAQKSGTVVFMGSFGSWSGVSNFGLYLSAKSAIRTLSETLHHEIEPLGLRSICFEPGFVRTPLLKESHVIHKPRIADYNEMTRANLAGLHAYRGKQLGDPTRVAQVILDVVRQEGVAHGRQIPLVLQLGSDSSVGLRSILDKTAQTLTEWEDVIIGTDFPNGS